MTTAMTLRQLLLLLFSFIALTFASSPTSFCKCTCFTNSTVIPLNAPQTSSIPSSPDTSASKTRTCNDCNKQFCLLYNLEICTDATEDDVFTTCFQRDSTKDEAVVFLFIFATVGLLAWAAVKPWVLRWRENSRLGTWRYLPVLSGNT